MAWKFPINFKLDLTAAVADRTNALTTYLTETDLMNEMRSRGWSFGAADFRMLVRAAVGEGRISEDRTDRIRGGGVETRYKV